MCTCDGRHTPFAPTLCTLVTHRLALLPSSPSHTTSQPSFGSWKEFPWLPVQLPQASLRVTARRTAPFSCLPFIWSRYQDICTWKIKTTPPNWSLNYPILSPIWGSPRDSGVTQLSEDRGRQHWLCPTKLISPVSCCGSLQKAFKFLLSFLIDHQ